MFLIHIYSKLAHKKKHHGTLASVRTNEFWVIHLKCDLEVNISNQLYFAPVYFYNCQISNAI